MFPVESCSVCGEASRTIVCEYNRLIFTDSMWDSDLARYDYALCHGCGIVYSTRRPERAEYEFLYENFSEFLLRSGKKDLYDAVLSPEMTEKIDSEFLPWWELRTAPTKGKSIREYLRVDLVRSTRYLVPILSTINVTGSKVLYIRAKTSALVDILCRIHGAKQGDVTTLFPGSKYLCEKNQGIRAICDVDFDEFRIPFEEKYDLIIENHILVHMIDPAQTFSVFSAHLNDDGCIFLRSELDDTRLFRKSKNLFAELRPFHFNQFDIPTLERMLQCFGFEPLSISHMFDQKSEVMGTAKLNRDARRKYRPIASDQLKARLQMYAQWRDESILSLPKERCRTLFGDELANVWRRTEARFGALEPFRHKRVLRKFAEANVPEEDLELFAEAGRTKGLQRSRSTNWTAKFLGRMASVALRRQRPKRQNLENRN